MWERVYGGEGRRRLYNIYLSLHCHHQNDSYIKMGSDESQFNVSIGSDGQSHKTQPFWRERRAEAVSNWGPSTYQPDALPLGQTGSLEPYVLYIYFIWLWLLAKKWHCKQVNGFMVYTEFAVSEYTCMCNQWIFTLTAHCAKLRERG